MRTLVIDTATEACSVALFDGDTLLAGELRQLARGHAEQLIPMIAALPEHGRADRIAVATGPGSFTGLRVGLASARALALAWQAELVGYPTLTLVAAMAGVQSADCAEVGVAMTGGHGEWFVQSFAADGVPLGPPISLAPDLAVQTITAVLIGGSQAEALVAKRGHGHALAIWPDARAFSLLPASMLSKTITLNYGRAPDAKLSGKSA